MLENNDFLSHTPPSKQEDRFRTSIQMSESVHLIPLVRVPYKASDH